MSYTKISSNANQAITTILSGLFTTNGAPATQSNTVSNTGQTFSSGATPLTSSVASVTVTTDSVNQKLVLITPYVFIFGSVSNGKTSHANGQFDLQLNLNGAGYSSVGEVQGEYYCFSDSATGIKEFISNTVGVLVPVSTTYTIQAKLISTWGGGGGATISLDNYVNIATVELKI